MKLIHLSDLHLGKRLYEYPLLGEQEYILRKIVGIIDEEKPDGVIIAGDVYDKSVPSAEAVVLFDSFLTELAKRKLQVFVISGNHDSAERIAFGSGIMNASGIRLSPVYSGTIAPAVLHDEFGAVNIYMLPFIKPANVRRFAGEEAEISSYTDAVAFAVNEMKVDTAQRNILITHQFVTNARRSDSEEISVGGSDNVDASVFAPFDYVALGHLHSPQCCERETIRYCGTPLKYSLSEIKDEKSVTVVGIYEKGRIEIRTIPLPPAHGVAEIKGTFEEIMNKSFYENTTLQEDYVQVTLTDETDIPDAAAKLRTVYHRFLNIRYDNSRTRAVNEIAADENARTKSPAELFGDLFELQNNHPMSAEQSELLNTLIGSIWEGDK